PVARFIAVPEKMRPCPCERVVANSRLARGLGSRGLCLCSRHQSLRKVSSADRAARDSGGQGCGTEYRAGAGRPSSKAVFVQDDWVARVPRPPERSSADFGLKLLRVLCVVVMAHGLSEQTAWLG